MKISLFKLGLVVTIIGIIWISLIFSYTEKNHESILLQQTNSIELETKFFGMGIGYYKVYMPDFAGEEIFVHVLDEKENIIQEQIIQTKMSVGYFDFNKDGVYTVKITNISKNPINLQIEFGNTNSQKTIPAGILILGGVITMIIMSYLKLKNYSIEQPDENIS